MIKTFTHPEIITRSRRAFVIETLKNAVLDLSKAPPQHFAQEIELRTFCPNLWEEKSLASSSSEKYSELLNLVVEHWTSLEAADKAPSLWKVFIETETNECEFSLISSQMTRNLKPVHIASPEKQKLYDKIRGIREEIGATDFDTLKSLRELRDGKS